MPTKELITKYQLLSQQNNDFLSKIHKQQIFAQLHFFHFLLQAAWAFDGSSRLRKLINKQVTYLHPHA